MKPYLIRNIMLPVWQRIRRQSSLNELKSLESTQWLAPESVQALQWSKLASLLEHAYDNVPYYRSVMQNHDVHPADLVRLRSLEPLPILDRDTITRHPELLLAENVSRKRLVPNNTGGSTGEPLQFYDDRPGLSSTQASKWRAERWCGAEIGDRRAYLWGSNFDVSAVGGIKGRARSWLLNTLMLPAWQLREDNATKFWHQVAKFRPPLLIGYAGALYQWVQLLGNSAGAIPGLKGIIAGAESLYDEWRDAIEGKLGVPVYNQYGGRDIKFVAQECTEHHGMHVASENCLVEVVRDGSAVAPGELGEILITRLDNWAMPFIRYRVGDLGVFSQESCPCGRGLPTLATIEGRSQDVIVGTNGKTLSGLFFPHLMKDCPEIKEFQVHQVSPTRLVTYIVTHQSGILRSRSRIESVVKEHLGKDVQMEFEIVKSIPMTPSGKRRITISHLDRPYTSGIERNMP